ncbi:hypothetical protein [Streptomyces sp. NPDC060198]|uniref:hypothetical protein n=1 Tax=Streptomyces sp. NPDC060198 TaxID=3347070 RepID=UPI00364F1E42
MTGTPEPDRASYGGILMDTRPWLYADAAADALRHLARCTDEADAEGWERPAHAYRVVGHLVTLMQRLPDLLGDVNYLIASHDQEVMVPGADTGTELRSLYAEIAAAQTATRAAVAAVGVVHARLGRIKSMGRRD